MLPNYLGHNYLGLNYFDHGCVSHNCISHAGTGGRYTSIYGRTYIRVCCVYAACMSHVRCLYVACMLPVCCIYVACMLRIAPTLGCRTGRGRTRHQLSGPSLYSYGLCPGMAYIIMADMWRCGVGVGVRTPTPRFGRRAGRDRIGQWRGSRP